MSDVLSEQTAAIVGGRLDQLRELLDRRRAAALRLTARRDFAWLTLGGLNHVLLSAEAGVAPIVVTRDDAVVLAPVNEHARLVDEELAGLPLRAISLPWWDDAAAEAAAQDLAGGGALIAADEAADELQALRSMLHPVEHDRMRTLSATVNVTMESALDAIRPGESEHELEARLAAAFATSGARLPVVLVAADERIKRYRHPIPTATPIERRVMVVVVAERWGLHVAATQFRELEPRPSEIEVRAGAIRDVMSRMREATREGNTFGDVLAAARSAYTDQRMADEWALHHQGGSIGYGARERVARPDDATPVRNGMAFAWNPSAVGYKAEETLLLTADGAHEVLTTTR